MYSELMIVLKNGDIDKYIDYTFCIDIKKNIAQARNWTRIIIQFHAECSDH